MILFSHAIFAAIQAGQEIPNEHWTLKVFERLWSEGFMVGYPTRHHGRNLNRYQMSVSLVATLRAINSEQRAITLVFADVRRGTAAKGQYGDLRRTISTLQSWPKGTADLLRLSDAVKSDMVLLVGAPEYTRLMKQAQTVPHWVRSVRLPAPGEGFAATPEWAKVATLSLRDAGLLKGYPNGDFLDSKK